ncbi:type I toxin-antitoxin system toxin [Clostridioides sp. ES-S-0010-02]|uniref:type I toxin-antitoxin system toxin n=1 Tax=Clostridioides sp. ES-S-0010-02 TaxID=2770776 RepID=UPI0039BCC08C
MDNFLQGILASLIVYLISKLFKKVKSHSGRSDFSFELKIKFKKNKHLVFELHSTSK